MQYRGRSRPRPRSRAGADEARPAARSRPEGGRLEAKTEGTTDERAAEAARRRADDAVDAEGPERAEGLDPAHGRDEAGCEELGDAHALDAGQPVATLVLRAFGLEQSAADGKRARDQWARLGITVNELAAPVLCLNLPVSGNAVAAGMARAATGDPVYLTLRTLLRDPPAWDVSGRRIYVCENPSMLSIAADRLGVDCAPMVCTNGMPAAAQQTLLRQLVARGANLAYHGDFDWAGIRIGNFVMRELQASAWRFSVLDYDAACAGLAGTLPEDGRVDALWDARLSEAMCLRQKSIHEEAVWEVLAEDLARR